MDQTVTITGFLGREEGGKEDLPEDGGGGNVRPSGPRWVHFQLRQRRHGIGRRTNPT